MNDDFVDGHYVVTIADALEAHERICLVSHDNPAIRSLDHLAGALARPYCGYYPNLWQKAAVLMESLAGSQHFLTADKRTAITLVDLLINRSGYRLHPVGLERVTVSTMQLAKAVGSRNMKLKSVVNWYRLRLRRFAK